MARLRSRRHRGDARTDRGNEAGSRTRSGAARREPGVFRRVTLAHNDQCCPGGADMNGWLLGIGARLILGLIVAVGIGRVLRLADASEAVETPDDFGDAR